MGTPGYGGMIFCDRYASGEEQTTTRTIDGVISTARHVNLEKILHHTLPQGVFFSDCCPKALNYSIFSVGQRGGSVCACVEKSRRVRRPRHVRLRKLKRCIRNRRHVTPRKNQKKQRHKHRKQKRMASIYACVLIEAC